MKTRQRSFFDHEIHYERATRVKNPYSRLTVAVDWHKIADFLEDVVPRSPCPEGGRPPYEHLMMVKIMFIQRLNNFSDEKMEYTLVDSYHAQKFVGILAGDLIPDQNTIWNYREQLIKAGVIKKLFRMLLKSMKAHGLKIGRRGSIIDATFVEVPRQRNSHEENKVIKEGGIPEEWQKPGNEAKLVHKDVDARWTKKNNEIYYGYKNHAKVDTKTKLITAYVVTSAEVHDSQVGVKLVTKEDKGKPIHGDSAYRSPAIEKKLKAKGVVNKIHEKGYRNKPLTGAQIKRNTEKSKIRVRIEHVFGFQENSMHGSLIRTIGNVRASFVIGFNNIIYNVMRAAFLGWRMSTG